MDCSVASAAGYSEAELQARSTTSRRFTRLRSRLKAGRRRRARCSPATRAPSPKVSTSTPRRRPSAEARTTPRCRPSTPRSESPSGTRKRDRMEGHRPRRHRHPGTGDLRDGRWQRDGQRASLPVARESLRARQGSKIWSDLRSQNDPSAQVSIKKPFNYEHVPSSVDPNSLAMPLAPHSDAYHLGHEDCQASTAASQASQTSAQRPGVDLAPLLDALKRGTPHGSNELVVDGAHSANGHPIAVFGPQTSYFRSAAPARGRSPRPRASSAGRVLRRYGGLRRAGSRRRLRLERDLGRRRHRRSASREAMQHRRLPADHGQHGLHVQRRVHSDVRAHRRSATPRPPRRNLRCC